MSDVNADSVSAIEILKGGTARGTWILDASSSSARFAVKHFWGLITVRGRLERIQGQADVTGGGDISVTLSFDAASVQSGNGARDRHLRSDDFFAADRHPSVTFTAGTVAVTDHDRAHVEGVLTVAGRPHPIALDVALRASASSVAVDGEVTVDRTVFGMSWNPLRVAASTAALTVHLVFTRPG